MTTEEKIVLLCRMDENYRVPPKDAPYDVRWWCRQHRLQVRRWAKAILKKLEKQ
jgi:hypothetical protein